MIHTSFLVPVTLTFVLQQPLSSWLAPILHHLLCHIYQRALFEVSPEILSLLGQVWSSTIARAPLLYLITGATPWMGVWLSLAMQPSKVPYDQSYLVEAKHHGRVCTCILSYGKIQSKNSRVLYFLLTKMEKVT